MACFYVDSCVVRQCLPRESRYCVHWRRNRVCCSCSSARYSTDCPRTPVRRNVSTLIVWPCVCIVPCKGQNPLHQFPCSNCPCDARGCCRISPPCFLAECSKRWLNQGSFVSAVCLVVCFLWFVLCLCVYFVICIEFFLIVCLSVTVKWLAVKTDSEMTYTVSGGALNSTQSNPNP